MNTDRATVERVAESLDWLDLSIFAADTVRHATALLRALLDERDEALVRVANLMSHGESAQDAYDIEINKLLRERDEARELAKRWRDVYEWDAIKDPLPVYHFPWEPSAPAPESEPPWMGKARKDGLISTPEENNETLAAETVTALWSRAIVQAAHEERSEPHVFAELVQQALRVQEKP